MIRILTVALALATQLACTDILDSTPDLPILDDPCAAWDVSGLFRVPVSSTRQPLVYIPPDLPAGAREVLFMLHGAGGSPDGMMRQTAWMAKADAEKFVVVFPTGNGPASGLSWNAGSCCGYAESVAADDVGFLDKTADLVHDRVCGVRTLAVGQSNGAMMALRWACESDTPDAVATHAGALLVDACDTAPVPILTHHGSADTIVPLEGGVSSQGEEYPSVNKTLEPYLARNDCQGAPTVETIGDTTCTVWPCSTPTELCVIDGWEHKWPSATNGHSPGIEERLMPWFASLPGAPTSEEVDDTDLEDTDVKDTDGG